MGDLYIVAIEGLSALKSLDTLPDNILRNAQRAVNSTIRKARSTSRSAMEDQVNFPRGYLTGKDGRLEQRLARGKELKGYLVGRDRPTSLSRFVQGGLRVQGQGVPRAAGLTVEVKPGVAKRLPTAFAMKLRNNNIGIAMRLPRGKSPTKKGGGVEIRNSGSNSSLWLLYGPSVDQVFVKTREMIRDDMEEFMEREFERLMQAEI